MTEMLLSPIERAQRAADDKAAELERARAAVLEQVRTNDGHVAAGIVSQVAAAKGLSTSIVQRAVWALLRQGLLSADDDLSLRAVDVSP